MIFVDQCLIVRAIWGDPDIMLLVFAGSAAEFALNRAVDWLFFTNKLPGDPIGRLFSTACFAQEVVFVDGTANACSDLHHSHCGCSKRTCQPLALIHGHQFTIFHEHFLWPC